MANFDLHRRKIFWVEPALAFMLENTDADVTGEELRCPFPVFATSQRNGIATLTPLLER